MFNRRLKNYCACQYGVKIRLKMLIYRNKLRCFVELCLVLTALITFFSNLLSIYRKPCFFFSVMNHGKPGISFYLMNNFFMKQFHQDISLLILKRDPF